MSVPDSHAGVKPATSAKSPTTKAEDFERRANEIAPLGALAYPQAALVDGICCCKRGNGCERPGDHPLIRDAAASALSVSRSNQPVWVDWFCAFPDMNLRLVTGDRSNGLLAIEATPDIASHGDGRTGVESFEDSFVIPKTVEGETGDGRRLYFFRCKDEDLKPYLRDPQLWYGVEFLPGVTASCCGRPVDVPTNLAPNGQRGAFDVDCHPADVPVAEPPADLLEAIRFPNWHAPNPRKKRSPGTVGTGSGGNRTSRTANGWTECSIEMPCPKCGRTKWCAISEDGAVLVCHTPGLGGQERVGKAGVYYFHRLKEHAKGFTLPPREPDVPLDEDLMASVYDDLVRELTVSVYHMRLLQEERAFAESEVLELGYRSLPDAGDRRRVAATLHSRYGDRLFEVPGFALKKGTVTLLGQPGFLVPVRDVAGRILGLKIRHDDVAEGEPRYRHFSSSSSGGRSSRNRVHVPLHVAGAVSDVVRITEGEVKADFTTLRTGLLTLSIPGVSSWSLVFGTLAQLPDVRRVVVAFDADAQDKPEVADALRRLVHGLKAKGYDPKVARWRK